MDPILAIVIITYLVVVVILILKGNEARNHNKGLSQAAQDTEVVMTLSSQLEETMAENEKLTRQVWLRNQELAQLRDRVKQLETVRPEYGFDNED